MIKIYHNPRCSKSRQAIELLNSKNTEHEIILYLEEGLKINDIKNLLKLLNLNVRDIIRTSESAYKENNLQDKSLSEKFLIQKIIENPKLLQRPIIINQNQAVIGRPTENILSIL
ncbi:arsenate reductase (glutaredoxin) [Rickettsiales bacterium]|nr:arsenate reductase (glutaredoxin) [Rickettsiales bacterium]